KRGLGEMAADFGPGFLAQDRAARLLLYRGDMQAEWAAYGVADARGICEAFAAGINAWISLAQSRPDLMAPEFAAMGIRPGRWGAADIVRIRSNALVRNVLSEVARAQVLAHADQETDLARRSIEPPWTPMMPEGLDPAMIPADVLTDFKLATARIDISPERLAATLADAWRWTGVSDQGDVYEEGSNNWAISAGRSETGRPILASDPHRAHALPSLRSIIHLTGPGIDVIGAGEPALPGVSIGHNATAAFSLTIFPMDQEDLYFYETHPDDPELYRYQEGWERMTVRREHIAVKGAEPQEVVLKFTRHGPVLREDAAGHRAFALRSVWFEPGASAYFTSLAYLGVESPEAFAATLRNWSTPSVNQVYADVKGNIAWFAAGAAPVRPNWDGLLPVPGDGRYEWAGFHRFDELPKSVNPPRGFVATANEMNLPSDFAYDRVKLGFEWAERSRTTRIHEVLDGQNRHGLADSMRLQTDDLSVPARRLAPLLARLTADGDAAAALALLRGWDFHLGRNSAAAALHEMWWSRHLKPALLDRIAPDKAIRPLMVPGDVETLLALLETPDARLADRDLLLARTLAAAFGECRARLGTDPAAWAWGNLHHGHFTHPLSRIVPEMRDVGGLAKGGSGSTAMAATYRLPDFRVTYGASFRMVVDVGNWDNSRAINAPGQSGDPRSRHYDDLAPLWAAGEYVPLLYSPAAIDAAAETVLELTPA
ncbi:MAG: penicillin acylase family protein, partial [Rhodospirillales bacterium]|nr:penicillin acylase family protein [Rhodospirillales bacterium]